MVTQNEERKTIAITIDTWRKLMQYKLDLDCASVEEVIEKILAIKLASQLVKKK